MLNIKELERQWSAYKRRTLKPYLLGLTGLMVFLTLVYIALPESIEQETVSNTHLAQNVSLPPVSEPATPPLPKPVIPEKIVPKPEALISQQAVLPVPQPVKTNTDATIQPHELEPSFNFMNDIQTSASTVKTKKKTAPKNKVSKAHHTKAAKESPKREHPVAITSTSSDSKMQSLTKRFSQSKNPALGIVIARLYYEKKAYALAYKYALEVNAIDESNIDSWLISGQSLYFLDKKDDAIHLLESFIQKTHSSRAQKLLRQIRSGTLQ